MTAARTGFLLLYALVAAVAFGGVTNSLADPTVTGQWDFEFGDLRSTVGNDLEYVGDTAAITRFPTLDIGGQPAHVLAFGSNSIHQGFVMRHGAKPNGGGHFVNQYTLIMDLMYPATSGDGWRALFQTDPFNHDGNDAEFYVGDHTTLPDPDGIGTEGQFNESLVPGTWYRIAFAVDLTAPADQQLTKYVNGVQVGQQPLSGGVDGRFALGPSALLFTAGNSAGGFTRPGFVNSIQFIDGRLPPDRIAILGAPTATGLPVGNAAIRFSSIVPALSTIALSWTGPDGQFLVQGTTSLLNSVWQAASGLVTNHSITLPLTGAATFYRVEQFHPDFQVGPLGQGEEAIPSKQILRAAGQELGFAGRPVDLALSPDGKTVYIKDNENLLVADAVSWNLYQALGYPGSGASMHGIAVSPDGSQVYVTGAGNELYVWAVNTNRLVGFSRGIYLPAGSDPCGLAISSDGARAYVCLSTSNMLAVVDLANGSVIEQIKVGIAPWDVVLSPDGTQAYVSDWGGRVPVAGDLTAPSAGTQVVIDSRGVAATGAISFVDLMTGAETVQVPTGLHPCDLELSADGRSLFVANANSDTVTVIDTQSRAVKETILVRPDPTFAYGSAADALALSKDGKFLFVASAGNNAVAVAELPNDQHSNTLLLGFLPTDWYPGALVVDSHFIYVVNVKGLGSRFGPPGETSWQIGVPLGTANKIPIPSADALSEYTAQVFEDGRVPAIKQTQEPAQSGLGPVPVPLRVGEPSVFQHVLYIVKENKTYDQVFGDLPQGNGDPGLCIYPDFVSPNHHELARRYVLLDNFCCNGVVSADGHSWATESNCTDNLEKSFGGFSRGYVFWR